MTEEIVARDYAEFVRGKINLDNRSGFTVDKRDLCEELKPHQADICQWALDGGRRAIFAAFGLGKTPMQIEILRQIWVREGGHQLVIAPLGVRQEFVRDARSIFGIEITFARRSEEIGEPGLYITNYESVRDAKLDVNLFNAVSLDEASVLRSYGSKTFQSFLAGFTDVKYRFVATATPSPNRFKELIHYAGFLGILDTGQALTRFFQRDSTKANNLQLHPHKEREFWLWVSSWAVFLQKPSDLGYSDEGYDLPPLNVHYHETEAEPIQVVERDGQVCLFSDAVMSLKDASRIKRDSVTERIDIAMRIATEHMCAPGSGEQVILWCHRNDEQAALEKALKARGYTCSSIHGSLSVDECEALLLDWRERRTQALVGKPVMLGSGVNLQQCNTAVFVGVDYKFNDAIQAVHRIRRYLQTRPCHVHFIHTDSERGILKVFQDKWTRHVEMVETMSEIIRKYGLSHQAMNEELRRSIGVDRAVANGHDWTAVRNDCVLEAREMLSNSVDLIHTSIPFGNHYEYSATYEDFGHNEDFTKFFEQMDYLTPELLRVLKPGRVYACHVKDRIQFGNVTGYGMPTVEPFHVDTIQHCIRHGFAYMGMITVVTDVVRENNQTYRLGWTEQCKDGSKMGVGSPEYILLFRKLPTDTSTAYADVPVQKSKQDYTRAQWQVDAHAFWRSSGNRLLTADELALLGPDKLAKRFTQESLKTIYDYEAHVTIGEALELRGALPSTFMAIAPGSADPQVWTDVNRMLTLNGAQAKRNHQNHICPLQTDIVERIIRRYSNTGETVFDPFGGLMTVPYIALKLGRKGLGVELNYDYWLDGVQNLQAIEREVSMPSLFDALELEAEAA